ncbi:hypothetical protein [Methylocella sp.]|jgi:hypothetical protein|uniref:hypothetical protein n=1 Tax=Methylocella sp. TaxID=1978226 RepID=UPI003C13715F
MTAWEDAKTAMAWRRLVHGHSWAGDPAPIDIDALTAKLVALLRNGKPVPAFAATHIADLLDPPGAGGEISLVLQLNKRPAQTYRTQRRDYGRGLEIIKKLASGKRITTAIREVLLAEKAAAGEPVAELTRGEIAQGFTSWEKAQLMFEAAEALLVLD